MKIANYLLEKKNLIVFDNNETINKTEIKIKNNSLDLKGDNEFFLVINNYTSKELLLNLEEDSNVKLYLISFQSRKTDLNLVFNLKENSRLELFTQFSSTGFLNLDVDLIFRLNKNASLKLMNSLAFNGKVTFNEKVYLLGSNANTEIHLLNVGGNKDIYKVTQDVYHEAKNTFSEINNWLITTKNSSAEYSVSGYIRKGMELSKCHQHNQGIMLSDFSSIAVEPKLYIDEYNVEASHGAAIGQMDEEELFYLLSRGLTETEAKSLIISGYINPFVDMIEDKDIKKKLTAQISRIIKRG